MDKKIVLVKKLPHFRGELPQYQTALASGCDVQAMINSPLRLERGERVAVPTGLAFAIPPGYEIQVRPRSGLSLKKGLTVINAPGTIDADYRGELKVLLVNLGKEPVEVLPGERIAQLVLCPVVQIHWQEVTELSETVRGEGGFGSTGV